MSGFLKELSQFIKIIEGIFSFPSETILFLVYKVGSGYSFKLLFSF